MTKKVNDMTTPLNTPVTINLHLETQEDVLALALRANLDADNLRYWYHTHRGKTQRVVPDTGFSELFKALRGIMAEEGFDWDVAPSDDSRGGTGATLNITSG